MSKPCEPKVQTLLMTNCSKLSIYEQNTWYITNFTILHSDIIQNKLIIILLKKIIGKI